MVLIFHRTTITEEAPVDEQMTIEEAEAERKRIEANRVRLERKAVEDARKSTLSRQQIAFEQLERKGQKRYKENTAANEEGLSGTYVDGRFRDVAFEKALRLGAKSAGRR